MGEEKKGEKKRARKKGQRKKGEGKIKRLQPSIIKINSLFRF
jgi:endonuclease I